MNANKVTGAIIGGLVVGACGLGAVIVLLQREDTGEKIEKLELGDPGWVLVASTILLVTEEGDLRGRWYADAEGATGIELYGGNMKRRLACSLGANGDARVQTFDATGTPRATVYTSDASGGLILMDGAGRPAVGLVSNDGGTTSLNFWGSGECCGKWISHPGRCEQAILFGKDEEEGSLMIEMGEDGQSSMTMFNEDSDLMRIIDSEKHLTRREYAALLERKN